MAEPSLYVTDTPGPASTLGGVCVWAIRQEYDVIPTLVCSICLSVGLVYCFFGYRCFKMVMFLSGFTLGSSVVCLLSLVQKDSVPPDTELGLGTKAGISLGVGVLCGLLTMLVSTLGLFLTGLQLGGVLSGAALLAVAQFHPSLSPWWAPLSALLAASVLCALLTLRWQKPLTVGSTAVVGAAAVALSVDYLVEAFPLAVHLGDAMSGVAPYPLCWISGALMGIGPALSLAGVLVQWRVTAVGLSHSEWAEFRKQQAKAEAPTSALQYRRSHRRAPSQRRRGPPPLRRYAGDVLAPSYIRSLQERQMGTGSSSSSSTVSTVTCTVIDLDFETGSMAPLTASSPGFRL